jgi:mannose-1-phosphate guanylyltransferase
MINREERPWGWFETIEESENYKLKKIFVNPNQQFSLQYHNDRDEHWVIVEGSGMITIGSSTFPVYFNQCFVIPKGKQHRLKASDSGILFYEVQTGICNEDDIVRIEDDYGRTE